MIADLIIGIIKAITSAAVGVIGVIRPSVQLGATALYILTKLTEITTMGGNFIHFMIGDYQNLIGIFVISLVTIKYVVYPIVKIIVMLLPIGN